MRPASTPNRQTESPIAPRCVQRADLQAGCSYRLVSGVTAPSGPEELCRFGRSARLLAARATEIWQPAARTIDLVDRVGSVGEAEADPGGPERGPVVHGLSAAAISTAGLIVPRVGTGLAAIRAITATIASTSASGGGGSPQNVGAFLTGSRRKGVRGGGRVRGGALRVLEAVLAEGCELDHQVQGIGRSGRDCFLGGEHRFVMYGPCRTRTGVCKTSCRKQLKGRSRAK
jgi:hypothetical protein